MPFGAHVFYDRAKRERLVANLDARFSKPRSGIHVSDLVHCFARGSFVSTLDGWKPIEQVSVGDWVLTHRDRYMPVTAMFKRHYKGKLIEIKTISKPRFLCTPEHQILTRSGGKWGRWIEAQVIKAHRDRHGNPISGYNIAMIPTPGPVTPSLSIGEDLARLIGIFLAEGNLARGRVGFGLGRAVLSFGIHEKELIHDVEDLLRRLGRRSRRLPPNISHCQQISFGNASLLRSLYLRAPFTTHNKYLPIWVLSLPANEKRLIWEWYVRGDGYIRKERKGVEAYVTSPALADGFRLLLQSLGYQPNISYRETQGGTIQGRKIRGTYGFAFSMTGLDAGGLCKHRARMTTRVVDYAGDVFNLEVYLDNSYTVSGVAVHNCLRQAAFRRLQPKPLTDRDLSYFSSGHGFHYLLENLYGAQREVRREWQGIRANYDLLDSVPIELKSSRSFWRHVQPHWIRQLAYYCAIENAKVGGLIVLWLFPNRLAREDGMIETYSVEFPNIEQIRDDLQMRRDLLSKALESQNVMVAPQVTEPSDRWLCNNCPYTEQCGR